MAPHTAYHLPATTLPLTSPPPLYCHCTAVVGTHVGCHTRTCTACLHLHPHYTPMPPSQGRLRRACNTLTQKSAAISPARAALTTYPAVLAWPTLWANRHACTSCLSLRHSHNTCGSLSLAINRSYLACHLLLKPRAASPTACRHAWHDLCSHGTRAGWHSRHALLARCHPRQHGARRAHKLPPVLSTPRHAPTTPPATPAGPYLPSHFPLPHLTLACLPPPP